MFLRAVGIQDSTAMVFVVDDWIQNAPLRSVVVYGTYGPIMKHTSSVFIFQLQPSVSF